MILQNSLRTEGGVAGYLPTTPFHKRRVKKQMAKIQVIQRQIRESSLLRKESERRVQELELSIWWSDLGRAEREHARTICLTQGYREAVKFVEAKGMHRHRGTRYYI